MIYRVVGPRSFLEMVNFNLFFKFSRGGEGGARENLKNKLKLTISLPKGPLKEPFIYMFNSKFIHFLLFIGFIYIFN